MIVCILSRCCRAGSRILATVDNGKQQVVSLYDGEILTVTATADGGFVWRLPDTAGSLEPTGTPQVVALGPKETKTIGPFDHTTQHKIDAHAGPIDYSTSKAPTAQLAPIAARSLAKSGTTNMSLRDKMKNLAAKAKQLPADLEAATDVVSARMDALDKRGVQALATVHSTLDDVEAGVAATEDAVNQLSNGGPALTPPATAGK